ncbi:DNA-binding response regulator [Ruania alkalisoli]|uniref:DNA-binding response regulator n=1 Tax=Ruania alkalisoli TaxID=2779775 RepID=A0A7M1SRB1_9MICO|nr:LuxR C-terminal-related transcriptional regulator [Ruania alkalisoli]QOR69322.1 DNA-binding response regulator [Ruania alkalisoli]
MGASPVQDARRACERRAWRDACVAFARADEAGTLEAADLETWAIAAHLTGQRERAEAGWTRAHHEWIARSDPGRAVRCAFWLGLTLVLAGDHARGGGWFARAGHVAADDPDDAARAYLRVPVALQALHGGRPRDALSMFILITEIADGVGDPDLATLGRLGQGQARVALGEPGDGLSLLDEAMVAVTGGEVSPLVAGIVYCAVILACRDTFDVRRAQEWTTGLSRWCADQQGIHPYQGQCLVHRSELLQLRGAWAQALEAVNDARSHLARADGDPVQGLASYQLGELLRLRGESERAEAAYRDAARWGHPLQPGIALLRLAQGRTDDARDGLAAVLAEPQPLSVRIRTLAAAVEVALTSNEPEQARDHLDRLCDAAAPVETDFLRATCDRARGRVHLAEGRPDAAAEALRAAIIAWHHLQAPYEAARTAIYLGAACTALGDHDSATVEWDAARSVLAEMGASVDLDLLARMRAGELSSHTHIAPSGLSDRERQVLVHVAAGETNRQIGAALVISEHTVRRHLQNIFSKLDLPSRAAATAWAYRHGLIDGMNGPHEPGR